MVFFGKFLAGCFIVYIIWLIIDNHARGGGGIEGPDGPPP